MKAVYEGHRDNDKEIRCFYNDVPWFLHFHSNVEILYSLSDDKLVTVNGVATRVKNGQFILSDSFDSHSNTGGGRYLVLLIPLGYLEGWNKQKRGATVANRLFSDEDGSVFALMEQIRNSLSKNELIKQGLINLLLGKILEKTSFSREKFKNVSTLAREIIVYVNNNFRENITLDSLAKALGYSKSHISHVINEGLNASLTGYLNRVRLQKFVENLHLIKDKEKTITLAFDCGFSSVQTFYRNFKKEYGCTPYEYYKKKYK